MLDDEIEERVDGVQSTAVDTDLAERLADHRGVGAFDDLGVEEVAVPHPRAVLAPVVLAERAPVVLVLHQLVAVDLGLQMQSCRARTELLEHRQVDSVRIDLEGDREVLPTEVPAELVDEPRNRPHRVDDLGASLDVGRREQAGLELATSPEAQGAEGLGEHVPWP